MSRTLVLASVLLCAAPAGAQPLEDAAVQDLAHRISFLASQGSYAQALPLADRAYELISDLARRSPHREEWVAGATEFLQLRAQLRHAMHDYDGAEALLEQVLADARERGETDRVIAAADALASVRYDRGDLDGAAKLYDEIQALVEPTMRPDHRARGLLIMRRGLLLLARGRADEAAPLLERGRQIVVADSFASEGDVLPLSLPMAWVHGARGRGADAVREMEIYLGYAEGALVRAMSDHAEARLLSYVSSVAEELDMVLSVHADVAPELPAAARLALTALLQRKGRVLETISDHRRREIALLTPQRAPLHARATELRGVIARQARAASEVTALAELARLREELEELEYKLLQGDAPAAAPATVTIELVQAALPADAVLVEIALRRPHRPASAGAAARFGAPRYTAYVLPARGAPRWVELGDAADIDRRTAALRAALADPRSDPVAPARAAYDAIMAPIEPVLPAGARLYIAPAGALNLLPFEALRDPDGRWLLERRGISYLTSGRDLLRRAHGGAAREAALIIADPDFGGGDAGGAGGARSADLAGVRFPPLPGTRREAQALARLVPGARIATGAAADRRALDGARSARILHIATHGFFLADQPAPPAAARGLTLVAAPTPSAGASFEDPLLRSGIALAGADHGGSGIVTALELAGLDLIGTQLVVLSACETGLGEVRTGEGVFGLRRALVAAGAETQVVSLWKVDDDATAALMTDYYRRLMAGGGRAEALREARLALASHDGTRHPYYWASFIVSGRDESLAGKRAASPPILLAAPRQRGCGCRLGGPDAVPGALLLLLFVLARRHR